MAESFDVQIVSVDLGAYIGATGRPLIHLPAKGGGITVLEAHAIGNAAGTAVGLLLVSFTDVGTPVLSGTIGSFEGTIIYAEGVAHEATISTAFVDDGCWIGVDQTSGTAPANTVLSVSYVTGK